MNALELRKTAKRLTETKVLPLSELVGYEETGIVISSESQMQRRHKMKKAATDSALLQDSYARGAVRSRG